MRVLLASFGTRGDLAPFVALGLALRARGHRVVLAGNPDHTWVGAYDLPLLGIGAPAAEVLAAAEASPRRALACMVAQVPRQFEALAPEVAAADVVLSGSMEYATSSLCAAHGRPRRAVLLSPCMVPQGGAPMPLFPAWTPRWAAPLTWSLTELAAGGIRDAVQRARAGLGLPPVGRLQAELLGPETWLPFPAALAAVERPLVAPVRVLPPWLLPPRPLSAALEAALEAARVEGPPPVFFGLGSMPGPLAGCFAAAAVRAGVWALPEGLVAGASHAALFPRCAVVVHHGGAGTTLTALRAGVPQVVLPRTADQPFHGALVESLGVGRCLSRRGLDPARLAAALTEALPLGEAAQAQARAHFPGADPTLADPTPADSALADPTLADPALRAAVEAVEALGAAGAIGTG